jgi:hypothetical protein
MYVDKFYPQNLPATSLRTAKQEAIHVSLYIIHLSGLLPASCFPLQANAFAGSQFAKTGSANWQIMPQRILPSSKKQT